jgi:hypothetical protein
VPVCNSKAQLPALALALPVSTEHTPSLPKATLRSIIPPPRLVPTANVSRPKCTVYLNFRLISAYNVILRWFQVGACWGGGKKLPVSGRFAYGLQSRWKPR